MTDTVSPFEHDHPPVAPGTSQRVRIVIDTSVLIADPSSLMSFPHSEVVIPLTVIEELDGLKTRADDVGRAARTALRTIEDYVARPVDQFTNQFPFLMRPTEARSTSRSTASSATAS